MTILNESTSDATIGVANLSRGDLVEVLAGGEDTARLEDFALIVNELFATDRISWELIFGQFTPSHEDSGLQDIVLLSPQSVHLAQRVPGKDGLVLISVADRGRAVGFVVSEARSRLKQLSEAISAPSVEREP